MLDTVAALGYKNGVENLLAHFGAGSLPEKLGLFTAEAILNLADEKNPIIADPLRLHDCSLVTDGAAALVISQTELAMGSGHPVVEISGIGQSGERLPMAVFALQSNNFLVQDDVKSWYISSKLQNVRLFEYSSNALKTGKYQFRIVYVAYPAFLSTTITSATNVSISSCINIALLL